MREQILGCRLQEENASAQSDENFSRTHHHSRPRRFALLPSTPCPLPPSSVARGFTLIELLVVIGVFSMITTVILANHSRFNGSVLLGNLAYDIALSVREAQVFGLSVKQFDSQFQVGYGIHFSNSSAYVLFADINRNNRYDNGTDSIIQTSSLGKGHSILQYCAETALNAKNCSNSGQSPITYLDIVFFRPDPDATISTNEPTVYSRGMVVVTSPAGETRTITVASTGQISVTNP